MHSARVCALSMPIVSSCNASTGKNAEEIRDILHIKQKDKEGVEESKGVDEDL